MREEGLVGKAGRLYRGKALPPNPCIKVGNRQRERGKPTSPNQQWVGDVTYLKVQGEWLYLAVVLDLYSRRIVGWQLGRYRTSELTSTALKRALSRRRVSPGMLFHSDRGSEYGAHHYQHILN